MTQQEQTQTIGGGKAFRAPLVAIAVGLIVIVIYASQSTSVLSVFGIATMVAGAALLVGGVLGFLFGIPYTLQNGMLEQNPSGEKADNAPYSYRANTNLEQISDWLTKMLVGVGLTQLSSLPTHLDQLSHVIAIGFGNPHRFWRFRTLC